MMIAILNKTHSKIIVYMMCFSEEGIVTDMNVVARDEFRHMGFLRDK